MFHINNVFRHTHTHTCIKVVKDSRSVTSSHQQLQHRLMVMHHICIFSHFSLIYLIYHVMGLFLRLVVSGCLRLWVPLNKQYNIRCTFHKDFVVFTIFKGSMNILGTYPFTSAVIMLNTITLIEDPKIADFFQIYFYDNLFLVVIKSHSRLWSFLHWFELTVCVCVCYK